MMSWWLTIKENGRLVTVDKFEAGGTQVVGGSDIAELNITYNYGKLFPFKELNRKLGKTGLKLVNEFISKLEDKTRCVWCEEELRFDNLYYIFWCGKERCPKETMFERAAGRGDYWIPSRENVLDTLLLLKGWFEQYPKGRIRIS